MDIVFQYICNKFSFSSEANLKKGIFDEPQIRIIMKDTTFHNNMTSVEKMHGLILKV